MLNIQIVLKIGSKQKIRSAGGYVQIVETKKMRNIRQEAREGIKLLFKLTPKISK